MFAALGELRATRPRTPTSVFSKPGTSEITAAAPTRMPCRRVPIGPAPAARDVVVLSGHPEAPDVSGGAPVGTALGTPLRSGTTPPKLVRRTISLDRSRPGLVPTNGLERRRRQRLGRHTTKATKHRSRRSCCRGSRTHRRQGPGKARPLRHREVQLGPNNFLPRLAQRSLPRLAQRRRSATKHRSRRNCCRAPLGPGAPVGCALAAHRRQAAQRENRTAAISTKRCASSGP